MVALQTLATRTGTPRCILFRYSSTSRVSCAAESKTHDCICRRVARARSFVRSRTSPFFLPSTPLLPTPAPGTIASPPFTVTPSSSPLKATCGPLAVKGGAAQRLTSNPGQEFHAVISPDGKTVAFSAQYEGPLDIFTMPVDGGLPQRRTWDGTAVPAGWTPDGRLLYSTFRYSTLPNAQLAILDAQGRREMVPLSQAAQGAYTLDGNPLLHPPGEARQQHQALQRRHRGKYLALRFRLRSRSAHRRLPGTSRNPMFWNGRVYFLSDRDGTMNIFSMDPQGHDVKQLTHHSGFDAQYRFALRRPHRLPMRRGYLAARSQ